jgi:metal-dependent amidase/aminoacylase/carboxypeptidase family protein
MASTAFIPQSLLEHLEALRHQIHQHPELGFQEVCAILAKQQLLAF